MNKKMDAIVLRTESTVFLRCGTAPIMQDFTFPVSHSGTVTYGTAIVSLAPNSKGRLIKIKCFANGEINHSKVISRFLEVQEDMKEKNLMLIKNQLI